MGESGLPEIVKFAIGAEGRVIGPPTFGLTALCESRLRPTANEADVAAQLDS